MLFKKKEKRSFVDDEESLLEYLSSLNMDANNKIMLGLNRYNQIEGWEPKRFVQTLCLLRDKGYISLYFYGSEDEEHACDVTMREAALTYFEDQAFMADEEKASKRHDYTLLLLELIGSAFLGFVIGRITG